MNSDVTATTRNIEATDRKLLSKAAASLRLGFIPKIVFTDSVVLDAKLLNVMADIAELTLRHAKKPLIVNASSIVALKLEVAGLADHFEFVTASEESLVPCSDVAPTFFFGRSMLATTCVVAVAALLLSGCSTRMTSERQFTGSVVVPTADLPEQVAAPARFANQCTSPVESVGDAASGAAGLQDATFGAGDVVRVDIPDGAEFSGTFAVNPDGTIDLPFAGAVAAAGRSSRDVAQDIQSKLIRGGYFHQGQVQVAVLAMRRAPLNVSISGAVFLPGRAVINDPSAEKRDPDALSTVGDAPIGRYIDAGLRAGAGVRPDADLSQVKLIRGGEEHVVDLTGLITGLGTPDVPLMAGDRLEVASSGCFHVELMRPSQATPPGMRVFMSNLTVPAAGNNPSAIDNYATNLPYGTRMLQAAASANCIGGTSATNARRQVVLISNNPITGKAEVYERSVEDLVHKANREDVNPFMLPNDTLACYDSGVSNIRDVARSLTEVLNPLGIILGLL